MTKSRSLSAVHAAPAREAVFSRRTFLDASLTAVAGAIMGSQVSAEEPPSSSGAAQQSAPRSEALAFLSIKDASVLLRAKKVSPVELTQACISRIDRLN